MRPYRLRPDLERTVIGGFALPLGFLPDDAALLAAPTPGYTVAYTPGDDDEPDSSSVYAVTSHERVPALVDRFLGLLPEEVYGILEIGSRDAYRSVDVFMAPEPISLLKKLNWPRVQRSIPNKPSKTAANTAAPVRVYSRAKPVATSIAAQITTNATTLNRLTR